MKIEIDQSGRIEETNRMSSRAEPRDPSTSVGMTKR